MSIQQLSGQNMQPVRQLNPNQIIKPGQIVQGTIIKLYPDNKAQIQLASRTMIAQLEVSLAIGERYHFLVQATEAVIRLKVLGEQLKNKKNANAMKLMQQLGLKTARSNIDFVQQLIQDNIPFSKEQLSAALPLLENTEQKEMGKQVLSRMIAAGMPLTDSVFQALLGARASGLTENIKPLLELLRQIPNQTNLQKQLISSLSQMAEQPSSGSSTALLKQILIEVQNNDRQLFHILKASGSIDPMIEFATWKSNWNAFLKQNNMQPSAISSQKLTGPDLPYSLDNTRRQLETIQHNQEQIRTVAQTVFGKWGSWIQHARLSGNPLPEQDFIQLKNTMVKSLLSLLPIEQTRQYDKVLQNKPARLHQLITLIETLADRNTFKQIATFATNIKVDDSVLFALPKEQFLNQIQNVLRFVGPNHEYLLTADAKEQQTNTVKSMLLQLLDQSNGAVHDRSQKFLHVLNGLQLQSVNENNGIIQASLHIPGGKFGLSSDIQMDFESKKTNDGMVNADHCRILFYLRLAKLNDTVIDMHIQKRVISITVFNDQKDIQQQAVSLKPLLKDGLGTLDYRLSTIAFKPLSKEKIPVLPDPVTNRKSMPQGVDYRI